MLSRVANSLFWLARYLERSENTARLLWVTHGYAQELRGIAPGLARTCWQAATRLLSEDTIHLERGSEVLQAYTLDLHQPASLISNMLRARENAREIRDAITSEMWEEINILYMRMMGEREESATESAHLSLLTRVRSASHLFQGLRDNTLARADEWYFLMLGQYLERADFTARLLHNMYTHPLLQEAAEAGRSIDPLHLSATLRACTAFETFSRQHHTPSAERIAEFLLLEARFPRSVEFCVQETGHCLHAISGTALDIFSNPAEQVCGKLVSDLRFASMTEIVQEGLENYLLDVIKRVNQLGRAVSDQYFP